MTPEFSRPMPVDRVTAAGLEETIEASGEERDALARRFDVPAIHALTAQFTAMPWRRGGIEVRGHIEAEVEQVSVVSLEPFSTLVRDDVVRYFQADNAPGHRPTVLSVESLEDEEPEVISGGSIDLGEIAAESLALALDPYPRKPGEVFSFDAAEEPEQAGRDNPFGVLSRLKQR